MGWLTAIVPVPLLAALLLGGSALAQETAPADPVDAGPTAPATVVIQTAGGLQLDVWVDGVRYGPTPVSVRLNPGPHFLTATAEGLEPILRPMDVRPGGKTITRLRDAPLTDVRYPGVFKEIVAARRQFPDNPHTLLIAALLAADRADFDGLAEQVPEELKATDPTFALAQGRMLVREGKTEEALAVLDAALKRDERLAGLWRIRTRLQTAMGRNEDAIRSGHRAVGCEPNNPENFVARGQANQGAGNMEEARLDYQRALELEPGHPRAQAALASMFSAPAAQPAKEAKP